MLSPAELSQNCNVLDRTVIGSLEEQIEERELVVFSGNEDRPGVRNIIETAVKPKPACWLNY